MKNFYWIDSFEGYPDSMDGPIQTSLDTYDTLYSGYAETLGYTFRLVHLEDLSIASDDETTVSHPQYDNILATAAGAYIGLVHPDQRKERKQEALYRLVAGSKNVVLLNQTAKFPMVCKDKFRGIDIARGLGLDVPATALIGADSTPADLAFVERTAGPYPLFIRPVDLTSGLGKKVLNDREALERYIDRPPFPGRMLMVQPCLSVEAEFRVYLDGRRIVACRTREPLEDARSCIMPEAIRQGSQALADFLETTYLCVDWLWDGSRFWFCEFETGGGFSELSEPFRSRVATAFFRKLTVQQRPGR